VQAEGSVNHRVLKHPVLNHQARSRKPLFARLEDELDPAGNFIAVGAQHFCNGEQDGRVPVMSTGMHHALVLGAVGNIVFFLDGQGVHVRSQHQGFARSVALQKTHHAGPTNATPYHQSHLLQAIRHDTSRSGLL
jgi:hypothetical protein